MCLCHCECDEEYLFDYYDFRGCLATDTTKQKHGLVVQAKHTRLFHVHHLFDVPVFDRTDDF